MSPHARRALKVVVSALALDVVLGLAFASVSGISPGNGVYYALTTASTVGYGDITPHGWLAKSIAVVIELTVIPLFAAAYSLMTAGLTTDKVTTHIDKRHEELKGHLRENGRQHGL